VINGRPLDKDELKSFWKKAHNSPVGPDENDEEIPSVQPMSRPFEPKTH
jgi:hypothetical protein